MIVLPSSLSKELRNDREQFRVVVRALNKYEQKIIDYGYNKSYENLFIDRLKKVGFGEVKISLLLRACDDYIDQLESDRRMTTVILIMGTFLFTYYHLLFNS